ncbi:hypothetical protein DdX_06750 [Ditylenchus destructor]|uniref:Uncharacterized protein n=1 Tax=Ditylenchus destructor TaxID=166010 RepID=A0AAD4N6G7_9BILA|nr:hypothetical protein DdX_06750 [Ditylenchus destructor]
MVKHRGRETKLTQRLDNAYALGGNQKNLARIQQPTILMVNQKKSLISRYRNTFKSDSGNIAVDICDSTEDVYSTAPEDNGSEIKTVSKDKPKKKFAKVKSDHERGWARKTSVEKEVYYNQYGITRKQVHEFKEIDREEVKRSPIASIENYLTVVEDLQNPYKWNGLNEEQTPLKATGEDLVWQYALKIWDEKIPSIPKSYTSEDDFYKKIIFNPDWWKYIDYICQCAIFMHKRHATYQKDRYNKLKMRMSQGEHDSLNQTFADIIKQRISAYNKSKLAVACKNSELIKQTQEERSKAMPQSKDSGVLGKKGDKVNVETAEMSDNTSSKNVGRNLDKDRIVPGRKFARRNTGRPTEKQGV